jgi:hypothetical protein
MNENAKMLRISALSGIIHNSVGEESPVEGGKAEW